MCESYLIVLGSLFFKEGVGSDSGKDNICDLCGCEVDFIEKSVVELAFEGHQRILHYQNRFAEVLDQSINSLTKYFDLYNHISTIRSRFSS